MRYVSRQAQRLTLQATMFSNAGSVRSMLDRKAKGRKRSSASTEEVIKCASPWPFQKSLMLTQKQCLSNHTQRRPQWAGNKQLYRQCRLYPLVDL